MLAPTTTSVEPSWTGSQSLVRIRSATVVASFTDQVFFEAIPPVPTNRRCGWVFARIG